MEETRVCSCCKIEKPLSEFYKDRTVKYGREYSCKKCRNAQCKKYRAKRSEALVFSCFKSSLKALYGITYEQWLQIQEKQNNRCAICGSLPTGKGNNKRLHVDHNHETNKIRGLLCAACNLMLGQAKDSKQILQNAIDYLLHWENK